MRNEVYKSKRNHPTKSLMVMLVFFALAMGACSDNAAEDELADGVIRVTAEATLKGDAVQTRTDYTEVTNGGMTVKWAINDAFTVFQGSTQQTFTLKGTDNDGKGHFSGTLTSGTATTLYALYPAAAISSPTTTASSIVLSAASQTQAANGTMTHLSAKDFMRGSADWNGTTGNVEFGTFAHLMAVLRLDITLPSSTSGISSIVLSGMNATQTLDLTKDPAQEAEAVWSDGKPGDITLTTTNGTPGVDKSYAAYLMVFPTTALKALTITVNLTSGASYIKKFTSNTGIVLNAGNRYWITVKDLDKVGGGSDSEDMGGGGSTGGGTGEGDTGNVPFD